MARNLVFELDYDKEPVRTEEGAIVFSVRSRPLIKLWAREFIFGIGYYIFAIQIFDDFIGSGYRVSKDNSLLVKAGFSEVIEDIGRNVTLFWTEELKIGDYAAVCDKNTPGISSPHSEQKNSTLPKARVYLIRNIIPVDGLEKLV
jgi:hypothetical protein